MHPTMLQCCCRSGSPPCLLVRLHSPVTSSMLFCSISTLFLAPADKEDVRAQLEVGAGSGREPGLLLLVCWCSPCLLLQPAPKSPPEEGERWVGVKWISHLLRRWISSALSNNSHVPDLFWLSLTLPPPKKSSFTLFASAGSMRAA